MEEPDFPIVPVPELFTPAHAHVLERLGSEEFWDHAFEIAKHTPAPHDAGIEYLRCDFANTHCLIPLSPLQEIIPMPRRVTRLPTVPPWMAGIATWRGEVISVIDLAAYFLGSSPATQLTNTILVVLQHNDITFGLHITAAHFVTIPKNQFSQPSIHDTLSQPTQTQLDWYTDGLVLDVKMLCSDIVQQIGAFSSDE